MSVVFAASAFAGVGVGGCGKCVIVGAMGRCKSYCVGFGDKSRIKPHRAFLNQRRCNFFDSNRSWNMAATSEKDGDGRNLEASGAQVAGRGVNAVVR